MALRLLAYFRSEMMKIYSKYFHYMYSTTQWDNLIYKVKKNAKKGLILPAATTWLTILHYKLMKPFCYFFLALSNKIKDFTFFQYWSDFVLKVHFENPWISKIFYLHIFFHKNTNVIRSVVDINLKKADISHFKNVWISWKLQKSNAWKTCKTPIPTQNQNIKQYMKNLESRKWKKEEESNKYKRYKRQKFQKMQEMQKEI